MATLMRQGGTDIRFIQQRLGHDDSKPTQIDTHVAIRTLQRVHAATHPKAMLEKGDNQATQATSPEAEALCKTLAQEAEEQEKEKVPLLAAPQPLTKKQKPRPPATGLRRSGAEQRYHPNYGNHSHLGS